MPYFSPIIEVRSSAVLAHFFPLRPWHRVTSNVKLETRTDKAPSIEHVHGALFLSFFLLCGLYNLCSFTTYFNTKHSHSSYYALVGFLIVFCCIKIIDW